MVQEIADIVTELARLSQVTGDLVKELKGNGQPGFISEVKKEITKCDAWRAAHDAVAEERNRRTNWRLALWGVIGTVTVGLSEMIIYLVLKK